jgi:hypothetical protein
MGILGALFDFSFTEFLTAQLVKFLYGLTVIGVGLAYIVVVLGSFGQGAGQGLLALVGGGIVALLALAYVRVVLEFVMVLFQIYENTRIIAEQGTVKPAQASPLPASAPSTVSRPRASVPYGPLMKPLSDADERRPFPT